MANEKETNLTDPLDFDAGDLVEETTDERTEDAPEGEDADLIDDEPGESEEEDDDGIEPIPDEDEEASPLALSEAVAKAIPEAERKRYEQHVAGVAKKEAGLKKREEALAADEVLLSNYKKYDEGLSNKETALDTYRTIGELISKAHGIDLGEAKAKADVPEEGDFEYDSDRKVYAKAVADAKAATKAELLKELGFDPKEVRDLLNGRRSEGERAKAEADAATLTPRILKTLKVKDAGWSPREADVKAVLLKNPSLLDKPAAAMDAVRAALIKDRDAHFAGTRRDKAKGPESVRGGANPGKALPENPLEIRVADLLGID